MAKTKMKAQFEGNLSIQKMEVMVTNKSSYSKKGGKKEKRKWKSWSLIDHSADLYAQCSHGNVAWTRGDLFSLDWLSSLFLFRQSNKIK